MRPFPSTSPNRSNHPLLIAMTLGLSACGGGGSREAAAFPTSPANLRLVLASPDAVTLEWTDRSDDEEGFLIERAQELAGSPGPFSFLAATAANVTVVVDEGLLEDERYWYRVFTIRGGERSSPSNVLEVRTGGPSSGPAAPTGLEAVPVSASTIALSWHDDARDEDGFWLERAADTGGSPGAFEPLAELDADMELYEDGGLTPGTTHWYRVRSFRGTAASYYAGPASATTHGGGGVSGARTEAFMLADDQFTPQLLVSEDGRSFVLTASHLRAHVMAFAPDGALLWQRELGDFLFDAIELRRAADGDLWLVQPFTGVVCRLRGADGELLWSRRYDTPVSVPEMHPHSPPLDAIPLWWQRAGDIASDGSVSWSHGATSFITEQHDLPDGGRAVNGGYLVLRFDADGTERWERHLREQGIPFSVGVRRIRPCPDGSLVALGVLAENFWMGRLDVNGTLVDQTTLSASGDAAAAELRVFEDPEGGFFALAQADSNRPFVFRLDDLGSLEWTARVDAPGFEEVQHVVARAQGGCFLVGTTTFDEGGAWVVALTSDGALEWERVLFSGDELLQAPPSAVATSDGSLLVVRSSFDATWSALLGPDGELRDQRLWTGIVSAAPARVETLPDGRPTLSFGALFLPSIEPEVLTATFEPSGVLLRSVRVPGSGIHLGPNQSERIWTGLRPDGGLMLVYPSRDSIGRDTARTLLGDPDGLAEPFPSSCLLASEGVTHGLTVIEGVALVDDPTVDITATRYAAAMDFDWIHPVTVTWQEFDLSNFQGTAEITERCAE